MKTKTSAALLLLSLAFLPAFADNGAVGSNSWIAQARGSASGLALLRALAKTSDYRRLPSRYIEFAGQIVFTGGNPFAGGTPPALRIDCVNRGVDSAERNCTLDDKGGFYSILKKGQTYDLSWVKETGAKTRFARVSVPVKAFIRLKRVFKVAPGFNP
jgi:hypothetical protein